MLIVQYHLAEVSIKWAETYFVVKLQTKFNVGIVSMTTHACVEWDHIMYVHVHNRKYVATYSLVFCYVPTRVY